MHSLSALLKIVANLINNCIRLNRVIGTQRVCADLLIEIRDKLYTRHIADVLRKCEFSKDLHLN